MVPLAQKLAMRLDASNPAALQSPNLGDRISGQCLDVRKPPRQRGLPRAWDTHSQTRLT
jgi:hypothetical protein